MTFDNPLTLEELWHRAPLSLILMHVGAVVTGFWLAQVAKFIERQLLRFWCWWTKHSWTFGKDSVAADETYCRRCLLKWTDFRQKERNL